MATINPYLNFNGNTEEAFTFYKSVFGGEFSALQRLKDMPDASDGSQLLTSEKDNIIHVSLPIGDGVVLMGSDTFESFGQAKVAGNNIHVAIQAESKEEAERLFNGLSADGVVAMPLADSFWGAYFGSFTDKFGIYWMVNYTYPKG